MVVVDFRLRIEQVIPASSIQMIVLKGVKVQ